MASAYTPSTPFLNIANTLLDIDKRGQERAQQAQQDAERAMMTKLQLEQAGYEGDPVQGFKFNPQKAQLRRLAEMGIEPTQFQEQPPPQAAMPGAPSLSQIIRNMDDGEAMKVMAEAQAAQQPVTRRGFKESLTGREVVPLEALGKFGTKEQAESERAARAAADTEGETIDIPMESILPGAGTGTVKVRRGDLAKAIPSAAAAGFRERAEGVKTEKGKLKTEAELKGLDSLVGQLQKMLSGQQPGGIQLGGMSPEAQSMMASIFEESQGDLKLALARARARRVQKRAELGLQAEPEDETLVPTTEVAAPTKAAPKVKPKLARKVGDVVTLKGGKQAKITKVNEDGTLEVE